MSTSKMELNEEVESKSKSFHELELDDRILKVKPIRQILIKSICYLVYIIYYAIYSIR